METYISQEEMQKYIDMLKKRYADIGQAIKQIANNFLPTYK